MQTKTFRLDSENEQNPITLVLGETNFVVLQELLRFLNEHITFTPTQKIDTMNEVFNKAIEADKENAAQYVKTLQWFTASTIHLLCCQQMLLELSAPLSSIEI